jgi:hypothetical protein
VKNKKMKRLFSVISLFLVVFFSLAKDNTIKFLGHPVDGSKTAMHAHLLKKGFKYDSDLDCYFGKFNGKYSKIMISTNHGKVDRVLVLFLTQTKNDIIYEYNGLIEQFDANEKYRSIYENKKIPLTEDIYKEITYNNKKYGASYYYRYGVDTSKVYEIVKEELMKRIPSKDAYYELSRNEQDDLIMQMFAKTVEKLSTGTVWFTIFKQGYDEYYIGLYYDNLNNRPKGEDL